MNFEAITLPKSSIFQGYCIKYTYVKFKYIFKY